MYDEVHIIKCGLMLTVPCSLDCTGVFQKDTQVNLGCTIRLTKFRLQNVVSTLMGHGLCSDTTEYSFYYHDSLLALLR